MKENNKSSSSFLDKAAVVGQKIGSQKQLSIIRDGFGSTIPLIMAGAMSLLIVSLILSPTGVLAGQILKIDKDSTAFANWSKMDYYISPFFSGVKDAAFNYMAIYLAFIWGMLTAKAYGSKTPMLGGVVGLGSFFTLQPILASADPSGTILNGSVAYLGAQGILGAMLTSLTIPILFTKLTEVRQFRINMPNGVPQAVGDAFGVIIPATISLFVASSLNASWHLIADLSGLIAINAKYTYLLSAVDTAIAAPLEALGNTAYAVFIVAFLISLLWMFGLHGSNVLIPIIVVVWMSPSIGNMAAYSQWQENFSSSMTFQDFWKANDGLFSVWTVTSFNVYGKIGGDGFVFALVVSLLLFSKVPASKSIAKLSLVPGVFNVSEPMVFGLPIMLNPFYLIPFLFIAPISDVIAFEMTDAYLMNPVVTMIPTQSPTLLLQYLFTLDWRPVLYVLIATPLATLAYTPFVFVESQQYLRINAKAREMDYQEFVYVNEIELQQQKAENKTFKPVLIIEDKIAKITKILNIKNEKLSSLEAKFEQNNNENVSIKITKIKADIEELNNKLNSLQKELVVENKKAEEGFKIASKEIEEKVNLKKEAKLAKKEAKLEKKG